MADSDGATAPDGRLRRGVQRCRCTGATSCRRPCSDEVRRQFVPDVPDGFVALDEAARLLGCARHTVLHKVQRGELHAVQLTPGRRTGLAIEVPAARLDRLIND
jgi:excisionase family DNA binding protein